MIAKSFRPVSTTDLDDFLDPWARFYTEDRVVVKRKHDEEAGSSAAVERGKNFVLCDLEAYTEASPSQVLVGTFFLSE